MNVIEVDSLTKHFRQHFWTPRRRVLNAVSFEVREKEIFGFLGPNGSGKSTTIKILLEIIFPDSGRAKLFGQNVGDPKIKKRIGFLPENSYFYQFLTARQFLRFHGRLEGLGGQKLENRITETLEIVGMRGTDNLKLQGYSKGMLQRMGLAQAILHDPDLVILDEPMTGLDPIGRKEVRDIMLELRERGKTVFFSTHILSDVETICDRLAIMNKGDLLNCGPLSELITVDSPYCDVIWAKVSDESFDQWLGQKGFHIFQQGESILAQLPRHEKEDQGSFEGRVNALVKEAQEKGALLKGLSFKHMDLEDLFIEQVGHLEERV